MSQKIPPMSFKDCLTPFVLGGLLVGITVLLAKYMSVRTAAYFYAYPVGFIVAVALLAQYEDKLTEFSRDVIPAGFCVFLFILMFGLIYNYNGKKVASSLIYATILWLPLTFIIFRTTDYFRGIQ